LIKRHEGVSEEPDSKILILNRELSTPLFRTNSTLSGGSSDHPSGTPTTSTITNHLATSPAARVLTPTTTTTTTSTPGGLPLIADDRVTLPPEMMKPFIELDSTTGLVTLYGPFDPHKWPEEQVALLVGSSSSCSIGGGGGGGGGSVCSSSQ